MIRFNCGIGDTLDQISKSDQMHFAVLPGSTWESYNCSQKFQSQPPHLLIE